ncbi:hypothetical protein BJ138DRAFT_338397 [Hygrophoropsis aurantiaca]|uniref:Uncharacterized protein n=1 Tax=Hygrophoropsis aurantiaca TaxID=72124 RepID=A0ACB8A6A6_9AGAM|nr:hypothetical protein BJ138DRAFT_338397 [Hygrophoropsis aurantiaca]
MLHLPEELMLSIATYLDLSAIFSLRKTCKILSHITYERTLWIGLLRHTQSRLPFPHISPDLNNISSKELEHILVYVARIEGSWLCPKGSAIVVKKAEDPREGTDTVVLSLEFILDRYLLLVKGNGLILLWDLFDDLTEPSLSLYATHRLDQLRWISCVSSVDASETTLYLALTNEQVHVAYILHIPLHQPKPPEGAFIRASFTLVTQLHLSSPKIVGAIDPESNSVLLTQSTVVDVMDWTNSRCVSISMQFDDIDEMWNRTAALRLCGPYIICFRLRSIELYPFPDGNQRIGALPILVHRFDNLTFRDLSVSAVQPVRKCQASSTTFTLSVLACDLFAGLFHYAITVTIAPVPAVSVSLIGRYPIVDNLIPYCALGPLGQRGIWIERNRNTTRRKIVAFSTPRDAVMSTNNNDSDPGENPLQISDASGKPPSFNKRSVMSVDSYDLREDIMTCALSESRGIIAFSTRSGAIKII